MSFNKCFFCCQSISDNDEDDDKKEPKKLQKSSTESFATCDSDRIRENIKRISHYLTVPKVKLTQNLKDDLVAIRICSKCKEISDKLGNLFGLLEVTQMKINYYLTLLSDQILKKNKQPSNQQASLTTFQEIIHKKCLTKLAKIDKNPVLQLTKCPTPSQPDIKVLQSEHTNNYDENTSLEEPSENNIPEIPLYPRIVYSSGRKFVHKFSCEYCPLTFQNTWNQRKHIFSVHLKKKVNKPACPGPRGGGHRIKPCEYCGAMMFSTHISAHRMRYHGISAEAHREKVKATKNRSCKICGKTFEYECRLKKHLRGCHQRRGDKVVIKCPKCEQSFNTMFKLKLHIKNNYCQISRDDESSVKIELDLSQADI